jgi:ABC-2 type transport system ATP-binding protein
MLAIEAFEISKSFPTNFRLRQVLTQPKKWFYRPRKCALAPLNLQLPIGGSLAILGPNGAGKTTLTKVLGLLLLPDSGRLEILGLDVKRYEHYLRQKVVYVGSSERGFYERLSARENLKFFAQIFQLHHIPKQISSVLEQVGLQEAIDKPVQMYSTGMRQRLAIARALLIEAEILLLDEPTRGIDPIGCQELYLLIEQLRQSKITVVLCTQILAEAERLGEQFLFLNHGQVLAEGSLKTIATSLDLTDRIVIDLINPLKPQKLFLPLLPLNPPQIPTCSLHFRVAPGKDSILELEKIIHSLRQQNCLTSQCRTQAPSLASIYSTLVETSK